MKQIFLAFLILTISYHFGCNKSVHPKTINEAAEVIISKMKSKDKKTIKESSPFDLIMYHHGWGTGIRNELGLWHDNKELMKDCGNTHPDDCSMKIIYRIWQILQENPLENAFITDYYTRIERAKYEVEEFIKGLSADTLDSLILQKASTVISTDCQGDSVNVVYVAFRRCQNPSFADIRIIEHSEDSIEFVEPGVTMHHPDSVIKDIMEFGVHSNCEKNEEDAPPNME